MADPPTTAPTLLELSDLSVSFRHRGGTTTVVDRLSLVVRRNETLCLVGESGCGKSVTALSIMRLLPEQSTVYDGAITYDGRNLLDLPEKALCRVRGDQLSMIFQEPMSALNPVMTVGKQVREAILLHNRVPRREAQARAVSLLERVGIPDPAERYRSYPHQLSGGMRQRVMIAMAIASDPLLLIADEPTTALDVTIQAQIVGLLKALQQETGMSVLLITHDLGLVAEVADRVAVMYAGRLVETAPVTMLFRQPRHPYTRGLIGCVPQPRAKAERLETIPGSVPPPERWPAGCRFAARCARRLAQCDTELPPLTALGNEHRVACFNPHEVDRE